MRNIPSTMATQHPDNAEAPYWDNNDPFIGVHKEIAEAIACFKDLDVGEFMWDWEGKHADAAVIDRLFSDYYDYFTKNQLGSDKFLTFRIPNIWEEKGYNLLQAMTVVLSSEDFARDLSYRTRPLFEVILPMTENADQLMRMHKLFQKLAQFKSTQFTPDQKANNDYLELIPLVESVESQIAIDKLLGEYLSQHVKHFGKQPAYIRPFLARSDPALVSGMLATVIANKLALTRMYEFSAETDIPVFPISGVGSLPFRGGLKPSTVEAYVSEYPGMRTVSVQSSFRYDHPLAEVKKSIKQLDKLMPSTKPEMISQADQVRLESILKKSAKLYQKTLNGILPDMQPVFASVPKRRDRRQHIGLLAYGRSMGEAKLPRAITFTAGLYSIGAPPEFIAMGRSLKMLGRADSELLRSTYKNLAQDLITAGRYINFDNLAELAKHNSAWTDVELDIRLAEEVLGLKFGPESAKEQAHKNLSANTLIFRKSPKDLTQLINELSSLRGSLG